MLCYKLLKNAEKLSGGSKIIVPIEYGKNDSTNNSKWLAHNGGLATSTTEGAFVSTAQLGQDIQAVFTRSEWDWKTGSQSLVIPQEEIHMNKGDEGVISLLKSKISNAEKSFVDMIGSALFDASPGATAISSLNGLGTYDGGQTATLAKVWDQNDDAGKANHAYINDYSSLTGAGVYYLPEGGVDNTIIGFDRQVGNIDTDNDNGLVNPWWNSYVDSAVWTIGQVASSTAVTALNVNGADDFANISFDKGTQTTNGVANIIRAFTAMYGKLTIGSDSPDLIIVDQVTFDCFSSALEANKRYEGNSDLAKAGFASLRFRNASIVVDSHAPAGTAFFLNSRYLDFKVHSDADMAFSGFKDMEINYGMMGSIIWMGELVCSSPRMQGVLCGLPTSY